MGGTKVFLFSMIWQMMFCFAFYVYHIFVSYESLHLFLVNHLIGQKMFSYIYYDYEQLNPAVMII